MVTLRRVEVVWKHLGLEHRDQPLERSDLCFQRLYTLL